MVKCNLGELVFCRCKILFELQLSLVSLYYVLIFLPSIQIRTRNVI